MLKSCLLNELMLSSWYNIKIQILILLYVNEYVIWAVMGWTLWWSDYGWWSVLKTNMYILMAWDRPAVAPVHYQWSCCSLVLSHRSVDISTCTYLHIRICLLFCIYIYVCKGVWRLLWIWYWRVVHIFLYMSDILLIIFILYFDGNSLKPSEACIGQ